MTIRIALLALCGLSSCGFDNTDVDQDGHTPRGGDCDDGDPTLRPSLFHADGDGDGFGDPLAPLEACVQPEGYVDNDDDCDDCDDAVYPGAWDLPQDGVDADCDGTDPTRCDDVLSWSTIIAEDPQGDHGGYIADIKSYEYATDGTVLFLRTVFWEDTDEDDPSFQIDMHIEAGPIGYNLAYDSIAPDPQRLQLWTSLNSFTSAMPTPPASLFYCPDGPDSLVLGIDLRDIDFEDVAILYGDVAVGWSAASPDYFDWAPTDKSQDVPFPVE